MTLKNFSVIAARPGFLCFCSNDLYLSVDEALSEEYVIDSYMYNVGNGICCADIWEE